MILAFASTRYALILEDGKASHPTQNPLKFEVSFYVLN